MLIVLVYLRLLLTSLKSCNMTPIQMCIVKDKILHHMNSQARPISSATAIMKDIGEDEPTVRFLLTTLLNQNFIRQRSTNQFELTEIGLFFIYDGDSFLKHHNKSVRQKWYQYLKTALYVINSLAILSVSIWAVTVANTSNKLRFQIEQKENTINELLLEIERINKIDTLQ